MASHMWGIQNRDGVVMFDTLRDSPKDAIDVVAKRIDAESYEELVALDFRLVRVVVSLKVTHAVKESSDAQ